MYHALPVFCCKVVYPNVVLCSLLLALLGYLLLHQGRKLDFVSLLDLGYLLEGSIDDFDIVIVIGSLLRKVD